MLKDYLKEKKEIVEKNLQKKLKKYEYPERLSEAMNYAVMNGGKRIRPILMYMMCDLFQKSYENVEDIAAALEFIHCYSLVHDDLPAMDNDMYRRGKLTTHIKFDEATAILVGDVLLTEAFNIISSSTKISDKNKVAIILKLSEYAGFYGMVGGQYKDVESEKVQNLDTEKNIKKNKNIEENKKILKYIHTHKTGKLLTAAIELPLIAFDTQKEKREKLVEYSKLIGLAFQIKDDILDIEGEFENTGKKSNDVENGKLTYPSLFGLKKSKEMLDECLKKANEIIKNDFYGNELLMELTQYFENRKK